MVDFENIYGTDEEVINGMKELFGLIDDEEKINSIINKLTHQHCIDYLDSEGCEGYYVGFSMKTKVMMDNLFEHSRKYIEISKCFGIDGRMLLNITDLIKVYAPQELAYLIQDDDD